jgi:hypothetical protein
VPVAFELTTDARGKGAADDVTGAREDRGSALESHGRCLTEPHTNWLKPQGLQDARHFPIVDSRASIIRICESAPSTPSCGSVPAQPRRAYDCPSTSIRLGVRLSDAQRHRRGGENGEPNGMRLGTQGQAVAYLLAMNSNLHKTTEPKPQGMRWDQRMTTYAARLLLICSA